VGRLDVHGREAGAGGIGGRSGYHSVGWVVGELSGLLLFVYGRKD